MLLYMSTATSYDIYNKLLSENLIAGGYQSQRFNYNIITGLSNFEKVVSLASLPYVNTEVERIEENNNNVEYICVENKTGLLHRVNNVFNLVKEGKTIIKNNHLKYIICDAVSIAPALATLFLARIYNKSAVAVVTDIMEASPHGVHGFLRRLCAFIMRKFDYYIFLTKSMNDVINTKNRPYIVVEGSCDFTYSENNFAVKKSDNNICLYGGALWKENAGLEYFIDGFIKADIPNTELHLYGTGELKEYIEALSEKYPQIKYMGCVSNQELFIKQKEATLLVNPRPTDNEFCKYSFPSKTFEYMASGTPVLMTRLPGIPDEYYKYVYSIDVEDSDFVCAKLNEIFSLSDSDRFELGQKAKNFVCENKNNIVQSKKIIDFLVSK